MINVLPLDPRFTGSNPSESNGFLKTIKIRSTISFVGEVKPSAPFRKILQHVKNNFRYYRHTDKKISAAISRPISFPPLLGVCCNRSREVW
jgi:hypothetical protein